MKSIKRMSILLIILLITNSLMSQKQSGPWDNPDELSIAINNATFGCILSGSINVLTHEALSRYTKIKPKANKWVSFFAGIAASYAISSWREQASINNGFGYDHKRIKQSVYGSIGGSFTISLLIGKRKSK